MFFEGSKEVFTRLFEKQRLLAARDSRHSNIRPLLLILSGTMRGVYGGGQVIALERFGLSEVFDTVVGVSTGTPTAAYFLAKQAVLGTSIYCEECITDKFISPWRLKVDVGYLADVFRGHQSFKMLDQQAIHSSRSAFFAAATCAQTGEGILIDAKEAKPDIVQAIKASIAIPGFTKPVRIGDRHYLDGAGAHPFPFRVSMQCFAPTDMLILANCPNEDKAKLGTRNMVLTVLATLGLPRLVRSTFINHRKRFMEELSFLRLHGCRCSIFWSDREVSGFERNQRKLVTAKERATEHLSELLAEARGLI